MIDNLILTALLVVITCIAVISSCNALEINPAIWIKAIFVIPLLFFASCLPILLLIKIWC